MDEQEAQMPPTVADTRELGLAAAGVVLDRELREDEVLLGGPDHHFGGELHAGGAQVELRQAITAHRSHPAVRVIDPGLEQQVEEPRQQRVADVLVMPWHRARVDVLHPVADHHVRAVLQLGDEPRDLLEVVGEIGVGHHDVTPAGGAEARQVGASVAADGLVDDDRSGFGGDQRTAVLRVVVGDDDLAGDPLGLQHAECRAHAALDRLGLVQARDDHRDLQLGGVDRSARGGQLLLQ